MKLDFLKVILAGLTILIVYSIIEVCLGLDIRIIKNEVEKEFKGKLVEKYFLKVNHYVFRTSNEKIDVGHLSHKLENIIEIGDSIVKYKNDNYCKLIKPNGIEFQTIYLYIPLSVKEAYRWPKEWKNKPKEWYGENME